MLAAVKELRFSAPFEQTDYRVFGQTNRCHHSFTHDSSASSIDFQGSEVELQISQEDDSAVLRKQKDTEYMDMLSLSERGDTGLVKLARKIARLVSALPDNHLISFR